MKGVQEKSCREGKGSRDSLERQNKESFMGEDKSEVNLVSFVYVF